MPRRRVPRAAPRPLGVQGERVEAGPGGGVWRSRAVTGAATTKAYRCPGCDQEVLPGTPHVVAWPEDDVDARRHWHTPCWRARGRRGPTRRR